MARITDQERLLRLVPEDGSSVGNVTLRTTLGWEPDKYRRVRQELIDAGHLGLGRGRGGSVCRLALAPPLPLRQKRLPSNPYSVLPVLDLATATNVDIEQSIAEAPDYGPTEYRRLVENTVGAIHQIPVVFYEKTGVKYELKQVEAYFGRSSSGGQWFAANLSQRFRAALEQRRHPFAMVFARTSIVASLRYERHGIKLLDVLRQHNGLCISNRSFAAVGRVGTVDPGFLYLTFRMLEKEPAPARELTRAEINKLVLRYSAEFDGAHRTEKLNAFQACLERANDVRFHGGQRLKLLWSHSSRLP